MGNILSPEDLEPFATISPDRAEAMIGDVEALAVRVAPCLAESPSPELIAAAKAILRRVALRWHDSGNAGSQTSLQQTAGPFSHNTTQQVSGSRGLFFPSEIADLQRLCRSGGRAFVVDQVQATADDDWLAHRPDLRFQWG